MKRTLNILITSLTAIIFIFSIYLIIGSTIAHKNNELFRIFGYSYAVVPTSSMEGDNPDSFDRGSALIIYNTPYEELEIGDVVVYLSEDNVLIIHRIIENTEEGFIVKGDNNTQADRELVTKSNYRGNYVTHFAFFNIGLWLVDARNILLLILALVLLGSVLYQVIKIMVEINKNKLEALKKSLEEENNDKDKGSS